ncbi:YqhG family protein [Lentibacillus sediminis]|uniref:YqhG family protein n=1 Tax=Lentibacillus sediminis TaxID=1940529 RepID=UPI000C1B9BEB|nr:YqhG family protein [Lentibacillus sediminis]
MAIHDLNQFLHDYFQAHECQIMENNNGRLTVKLTEEMDKALMNRPFYWHYIKGTGNPGVPMNLTLITNPEERDKKGEWIHFGSPRLQQILRHLRIHEKYTTQFQQVNASTNTALYPWLVTNVKISYIGKHKRDEIISVGLHLVNGQMKLEMMDKLREIPLQMQIADYCFTISPMIRLKSGFLRIEAVLDSYMENQPKEWAEESRKTLDEEIKLLDYFYTEEDDKEQKDKEIEEIRERYSPRITYEVINGGIFYLAEGAIQ